ncbi:hypothetical protein PENSPDRAFT_688284 [Peniophora sp. CONT]|nr:hypothetical protein PENSPDRAFT_688284 [Peniophora sp. CONT]
MTSELAETVRKLEEFHESSEAWKRASKLIKQLRSAARTLPATISLRAQEGFLAKTFTNHPSNLDGKGLWYSFNKVWERAFHSQKPEADKTALVLCGKHGLQIVFDFVEFYKDVDGMTETNLALMCGKLEHLLKIIAIKNPAPSDGDAGTVPRKLALSDADAVPQDNALGITKKKKKKNAEKAKAKKKEKGKRVQKPKKSKRANSGTSGSSGDEAVEGEVIDVDADEEDNTPVGVIVGDKLTPKQEWAYASFTRSPGFEKVTNAPIWIWTCRFCERHRTTDHSSASAKVFSVPPEAWPRKWSNLTMHLGTDCKKTTKAQGFEAWLERKESGHGDPEPELPESRGTLLHYESSLTR